MYKPIEKIKHITQDQLDQIIEKHPVIGKINDAVKSFKEILFSKKPDDLDDWLMETAKLEIDEITSFVNGTVQDKKAVKMP